MGRDIVRHYIDIHDGTVTGPAARASTALLWRRQPRHQAGLRFIIWLAIDRSDLAG